MTQQSKRRKKRYQPGSAYAGDVKPTGVFGAFANVRVFFIIGALIMVGSVALGGICSLNQNSPANPGDDDQFVRPGDDEDGTPAGTPAVVKQYDSAPPLSIDPSKTYLATINTTSGTIQVELQPGEVPETVNNFVFLARDGFYDGLTFHQVVEGFNVQAGDPNCAAGREAACRGSGDAGYDFPQEQPGDFSPGTIGMVNGSQFFIALDDSPQFDEFTPFGQVTSGLDVAERITRGTEISSIEITEQ